MPPINSRRKLTKKKFRILKDRLKEENPKSRKEAKEFLKEVEKTWMKISPFVGEEEAYGELGIRISEKQEIRAKALDFILWFVLFKRLSEKFDRELKSFKKKLNKELKWLKDNREFLDLMVKGYIKEQVKPQKKKEPTYRA